MNRIFLTKLFLPPPFSNTSFVVNFFRLCDKANVDKVRLHVSDTELAFLPDPLMWQWPHPPVPITRSFCRGSGTEISKGVGHCNVGVWMAFTQKNS